MIIVRLAGGLGNQLFQYALGRRLALDRNVPLKLDTSWFQKQSLRSYQLDAFDICAVPASEKEIEVIANIHGKDWISRLEQALQRRMPYYNRRLVREQNLSFDPELLKHVPRTAYLIGYWQSESYFNEIASLLRQEFRLKGAYSSEYQLWLKKAGDHLTCSLHVRRGDHVNDEKTRQVHGICPVEYYERAIRFICERFPAMTFLVFTDDMQWTKEHLGGLAQLEFVQLAGQYRDHEEMLLMSSCSHHIISNSSYSWWGAWIDPSPDKVVVAPQQWGLDPDWVPGDLIPQDWVRL